MPTLNWIGKEAVINHHRQVPYHLLRCGNSLSVRDPDSGVYIALFYLPKTQKIRVGKLGLFYLQKGVYFYVGSAQRNLSARINRHGRKDKPLRWHIDYLSAKAEMLGAITIAGPREQECMLARKLDEIFDLAVPGFGASNCQCSGHLFYVPELASAVR